MLTASLAYAVFEFFERLKDPLISHPDAQVWNIQWLRPFVTGAPFAVIITVVLCWFQTEGHVFEIHKDIGMLKHDRAVQIIAMPAVFAVMAMASMVPIYELVTGNISEEMLNTPFGIDIRSRLNRLNFQSNASMLESANSTLVGNQSDGTGWEKSFSLAMWRYETCFYVGDLFEAWVLYQFGLLALELIRESFETQLNSESEAERGAARECLASLSAVSKLAWLGTMSFVVVCVGQTACAMSPYIVGTSQMEGSDTIMMGFQVAGFIASGVALYNVFVVEYTFHRYLDRSSPLLKFMSVKILVSLSFFQRGLLVILQGGNKLLPEIVQRIVGYVPLFGDIINMTEVQLHMFYPGLILYECLLTTCLHFWAWGANETWYFHPEMADEDAESTEKTPLIPRHISSSV
eukprot:CAMPEP_0176274480 /NCGR_PEP_ID=MMETSP0121_2-20121125/46748_1 /TAXON_ID=160619 /ORGANISM="Kryptoperidinium foliaceum, Strain CCMP 1326" /LENGTH=404 /DNA_ID=CAMNT_0017614679 /DNA_START=57 /DNA_END=1271 /DNA_ORIENTATION=+